MEVKPGTAVISTAGRDSGKLFVVLKTDEGYAELADGKLRKVQKPKRKKLRHMEPAGYFESALSEKINAGGKVTNNEIRRALAAMEQADGIIDPGKGGQASRG